LPAGSAAQRLRRIFSTIKFIEADQTMATDTTLSADSVNRRNAKSFARYIPAVARVLMGLLFLITGLNGFLNFLPQPPTLPDFAVALAKTRYMFPLIMGTQLIVGVLLLSKHFVPLALVLIAPVVVNIVAFHVFLDRAGLPLAMVVLALEVYLIWAYRSAYRPMLAMRSTPAAR
jgi:uncharacterized membrane protein YphA (DoxX/SURF4 family)